MEIVELTAENISECIEKTNGTLLIDFWAYGCPPCDVIQPILDEAASKKSTTLLFAKINVDENEEVAMKYRLSSVPTLIIFEQGNELQRYVVPTAEEIIKTLTSYRK